MPKRYEQEIEDLLRGLEQRLGGEPLPLRRRSRGPSFLVSLLRAWNRFLGWDRAEQLMLLALGLAVLTWLFGFVTQTLAFYAALLGAGVAVMAVVVGFGRRRRYAPHEPRWRGRPIELRPRSAGLWWWLMTWWRRRLR